MQTTPETRPKYIKNDCIVVGNIVFTITDFIFLNILIHRIKLSSSCLSSDFTWDYHYKCEFGSSDFFSLINDGADQLHTTLVPLIRILIATTPSHQTTILVPTRYQFGLFSVCPRRSLKVQGTMSSAMTWGTFHQEQNTHMYK